LAVGKPQDEAKAKDTGRMMAKSNLPKSGRKEEAGSGLSAVPYKTGKRKNNVNGGKGAGATVIEA